MLSNKFNKVKAIVSSKVAKLMGYNAFYMRDGNKVEFQVLFKSFDFFDYFDASSQMVSRCFFDCNFDPYLYKNNDKRNLTIFVDKDGTTISLRITKVQKIADGDRLRIEFTLL